MSTDAPEHLAPTLTHALVEQPTGIVLMLHGGADRGQKSVDHKSLSWQRSKRMMREIGDDLNEADVAVSLLRYRVKGWNASIGRIPSPIPDARWAIGELRREHPRVPILLLGHSMGGRTAVAVADEPGVVGVVALAPWLPPNEPVGALSGKTLLAAHGQSDKITSARATAAYVDRATQAGAVAEFTSMGRVGHYMYRKIGRWNDFALNASLRVLGNRPTTSG